MRYYFVEPYVPGGLGENTLMDTSVTPPKVVKLHYEFEGWEGDALLTSYPVFLITELGYHMLDEMQATGVAFDAVEISKNDFFLTFCPEINLPPFVWLKPIGESGNDDFGVTKNKLVVSERVLRLLLDLGIPNAEIREFPC